MNKLFKYIRARKTAGTYVSSGLLLAFSQAVSGFIILRWLEPVALGEWQSFTVFVGYIEILTIGTTVGLNRELPYWLGKNNKEIALKRLQTAGYYTTTLSFILILLVFITGVILFITNNLSLQHSIMLVFAFSIGALKLQTNFLGATYRSAQSFDRLSKIQIFNASLYFLLIPLIYYFNLWGYIVYNFVIILFFYIGYQTFKPYKIKYKFETSQFKKLVKIGFPMFFWSYIAGISMSIPRLLLIFFGSPLLLGLYSPAGSINGAILNLPAYINRYMFPKMSYIFGQTEDVYKVYRYTIKASLSVFFMMLIISTILVTIIPKVFQTFFPKYVEGILAAQITLYSGVFYSVSTVLHTSLNSLRVFKAFKYIVIHRLIFIVLFTGLAFYLTDNLLIAVAIGAVCTEFFNLLSYLYFFKKETI